MNKDEAREAAWNLNRAGFTANVSDMDIFHAGFDAGYEAGRRWIPVSERLPDCEEGAFLGTGGDGKTKVAYWKDGKLTPALNPHGKIIAWMPLPPAYKED